MLERLRVAARPRTPWEAADLGLALLRARAGPVYRVWLATVLPWPWPWPSPAGTPPGWRR